MNEFTCPRCQGSGKYEGHICGICQGLREFRSKEEFERALAHQRELDEMWTHHIEKAKCHGSNA